MARVKGGYTTHRRHKKFLIVLKGTQAQGIEGSKLQKSSDTCIKATALPENQKERPTIIDDNKNKCSLKKMWISYSNLINNLKKSNIELDRKTLLLAYNDFEAEKIVQESSSVKLVIDQRTTITITENNIM